MEIQISRQNKTLFMYSGERSRYRNSIWRLSKYMTRLFTKYFTHFSEN